MAYHVRSYKNYVNLGNLYSAKPWHDVTYLTAWKTPRNSVNLGRLYAPARTLRESPAGWGYFEDGSVFLVPRFYLNHDAFETRMRMASYFVSDPPPELKTRRQTDPLMQRLVVILKTRNETPYHSIRLLARNAQDGERITAVDHPFQNVVLSLDDTGRFPVSATFETAPPLLPHRRMDFSEAMESFRGTLIAGVLQANVRLGNGLQLLTDPHLLPRKKTSHKGGRSVCSVRSEVPSPSVTSTADSLDRVAVSAKRQRPSTSAPGHAPPVHEDTNDRRVPEYVQRERKLRRIIEQPVPPAERSRYPRPSYIKDQAAREDQSPEAGSESAITHMARRIATLEAKERDLRQREELLRWKRKAWYLEQQLAQQADESVSKGRRRPKRAAGNPADDFDEPHNFAAHHRTTSEPPVDAMSPFDDMHMTEPAPPQALAKLRSRIELPTRRTLGSKRDPDPS